MNNTPRPRRASRWFLYGPFIVAALILLGWRALWNEGATIMKDQIVNFAASHEGSGADVQYSNVKTKGFPFFLRGAVSDFDFVSPAGWRYTAPLVHVDALPYALDRVIFSAPEPQIISFGEHQYALLTPEGRLSLSGGDGDPNSWALNIDTDSLRLSPATDRDDAPALMTMDDVLIKARPAYGNPAQIDISLIATGAQLSLPPEGADLTAQHEASAARDEMTPGQPITIDRVEAVVSIDAGAHGGKLTITGFAMRTDDGELSLTGELVPDAKGRPTGDIDIEIINPTALVTEVKAAGLLTSVQADALNAALSVASLAGGGKVRTTITIKNGEARLYGIVVARFNHA